jgi:transposase
MPSEQRLVVGIDIGRSKADLALLHSSGQPLDLHCSFANSLSGFTQAKQLLLQTLTRQGLTRIDFAIEATSYYWLPLYLSLAQDPELAVYQPRQALLNAGWVKWFKKSFSPDHKSDQSDPFYIAERLRTLRDPLWWRYDPHWLSLRLRTRLRFHLSRGLAREKNHYQLFLFLAYSSYASAQPFSDPFGAFSQWLLAHPDELDALRELPLEELSERLGQLTPRALRDPQGTAKRLYTALHESYPLPSELDPTVHALLQHLASLLHAFQAQIDALDREIDTCLQTAAYPEVAWLDSIPGLGTVFASGIAAEIGNLERFAAPPKWDPHRQAYRARNGRDIEDAIAKFAGLWWPQNASGQFEAEERPLSKRGNAYLRYFILLAADRMRLFIPSYARYYRLKFHQVTKHQHKRALVLTGRKALGLFVGLLRHQQTYQPEEVD